MSTRDRWQSNPAPATGPWEFAADLVCLGLGLAFAASTTRVFLGSRAVVTLAIVALLAWALAAALRRSPLRPVVSELTYIVVGVVAGLIVAAPAARNGVLPTFKSVQVISEAIRTDFSSFTNDIAPVPVGTGHLVVLAALVWLLALFASTAAMRLRTPVQAAIPHTVGIIALGLVARDTGRVTASVVLLAALGFHAVAQAGWRDAGLRWQPASRRARVRPAMGGLAILACAGAVTALVAPLLPVGNDPVLNIRNGGSNGGPRTVVSPFVEVGSNLGPRSDQLLFTVTTEQPGYWRLTSLDSYDPDDGIWVLSNSYEPVDGSLADVGDRATHQANLVIRGLGGIWVPTPADPATVRADLDLNWDPATRSLISRDRDLVEGDTFLLTAADPVLSADDLVGAVAPENVPAELLDTSGLPPELGAQAAELTAGMTPPEQARGLQDWFRTDFAYDETVDFSAEADPLGAFLEDRRGFCQQFSTAYALAARSLGLPTRVVVGFTPGDATPVDTSDPAGDSIYAVRGRHAHAWPEVLFDGMGWVPFEPTPGRGDPATTAITGAAPAQASPEGGTTEVPETTGPTTTGTTTPPEVTQPAERDVNVAEADPSGAADGDTDRDWLAGAWPLLLIVIAVVAAALWWQRRPGSTSACTRPDPVQRAWLGALAAIAKLDLEPADAETPVEFADRAGRWVELQGFDDLARLETARRWAPGPTPDEDAAAAAELEATIVLCASATSAR